MDERRTDDGGTTPPEDMPTQAFPPTTPADPAAEAPADAPASAAPAAASPTWDEPATSTTTPPAPSTPPPASDWQPASTTVTSVPVGNWQQPATTAPPPPADQPPPAVAAPAAVAATAAAAATPPPAPTWQQAAPPAAAAAAATPWQPPQSQWVQPAPAVVQGGTTGLAKVGSVILILLGLLTALVGVLFTVAVNALRDALETQFVQLGDAFADVAVTIGIVVVVIGIVEVLTGIFSWRGSGWARVVGIIYGLLLGLLFVAGLFGPRSSVSDVNTGNGLALTAVISIAYLYTAIVFLFRYRSSRST